MRVVYTSTASKKEAQRLCHILLEEKAAACVQMTKIKSSYIWKNKLCSHKEYQLCIKSSKQKIKQIYELLKLHHSYEVFEFITIKPKNVNKAYKQWLEYSLETRV